MLYFIAIVAPDHINEQVLIWKNYMKEQYGCNVALRSPAHITLVPPFSMKEENETDLSNYLKEFSSTEKSFPVSLKDFDNFKPRVIFLHVEPDEPLLQLQKSINKYLLSLNKFPIKKEDRPFHPHITIANRDLNQKDFPKAWAHFKNLSFRAGFTADRISLLKHNKDAWQIADDFPLS